MGKWYSNTCLRNAMDCVGADCIHLVQDREMRVISSLTREVVASDEGLCCTELGLFEQWTDRSNRASRSALGPTQPPVQKVQGALPHRKSCRGVKLTTHFHLVPRFRMREVIPPLSEIYGLLVCDDALLSRRRLPVRSLLPPRRQVLTKYWY